MNTITTIKVLPEGCFSASGKNRFSIKYITFRIAVKWFFVILKFSLTEMREKKFSIQVLNLTAIPMAFTRSPSLTATGNRVKQVVFQNLKTFGISSETELQALLGVIKICKSLTISFTFWNRIIANAQCQLLFPFPRPLIVYFLVLYILFFFFFSFSKNSHSFSCVHCTSLHKDIVS